MAGRFEIYVDDNSQLRFRLTGDDGATLMTSEPYADKQTAVDGIDGIRNCASTAFITDLTESEKSPSSQ
ncbi:hypothetical protein GCM10027403_33470 [Arthrobacter tecti]